MTPSDRFENQETAAFAGPDDFYASSGAIDAKSISVGATYTSTTGLHGEQIFKMPTLVVYSSKTIGTTLKGDITSLAERHLATVFDIASYTTIDKAASALANDPKIRSKQFKNIVLMRHGLPDGAGSADAIAAFAPDSPLMPVLATKLADNGSVWFNWCFANSFMLQNPGYLPAMARIFHGVDLFYGSGMQGITTAGVVSSAAAVEGVTDAGIQWRATNQYLDYLQYVPRK